MSALWTIVATAFVLVVLAVVAYGFLVAPFRRHLEQFRNPRTGMQESPHLEMRDEFEETHNTGSPHLETRHEFEHRHIGVA